jgi:hypothetical protein
MELRWKLPYQLSRDYLLYLEDIRVNLKKPQISSKNSRTKPEEIVRGKLKMLRGSLLFGPNANKF